MAEHENRLTEYSPEELGTLLATGWREALARWGNPRIPTVKTPQSLEEITALGAVGQELRQQLAFMTYPGFETFANLQNIDASFSDFGRGYRVVAKHESGHRLCPYDKVTSLLLMHAITQAIPDKKPLAHNILNLYTDTCINTHLVRTGDDDLPWAYRELTKKNKAESSSWRVYARSMELLWGADILPPDLKLAENEATAGQELAIIFKGKAVISKAFWKSTIGSYAHIIAPFLEEDKKNGKGGDGAESGGNGGMDATASENAPDVGGLSPEEREKVLGEIAREISQPGTDGLPTNRNAVKEYRDFLAGTGVGDPVTASISFYERLASRYNVKFATKPFGRPRRSPFSVIPWTPSDPVTNLDVQHTIMTNGAVIPGVTTKQWRSRATTVKGGEEEVIPTLDLYIDSSGSMPDPTTEVSLPVLASFVAERRAVAAGVGVRVVNYAGKPVVRGRTVSLPDLYKTTALYQRGGTIFPVKKFLDAPADDPRLSLIVTDTFLANEDEAIDAIAVFRARNRANRVTIYAITSIPNADRLRQAGAEVIHGTKPNIFKHIIGKTENAYLKT